jgi:hypothetical protein
MLLSSLLGHCRCTGIFQHTLGISTAGSYRLYVGAGYRCLFGVQDFFARWESDSEYSYHKYIV